MLLYIFDFSYNDYYCTKSALLRWFSLWHGFVPSIFITFNKILKPWFNAFPFVIRIRMQNWGITKLQDIMLFSFYPGDMLNLSQVTITTIFSEWSSIISLVSFHLTEFYILQSQFFLCFFLDIYSSSFSRDNRCFAFC